MGLQDGSDRRDVLLVLGLVLDRVVRNEISSHDASARDRLGEAIPRIAKLLRRTAGQQRTRLGALPSNAPVNRKINPNQEAPAQGRSRLFLAGCFASAVTRANWIPASDAQHRPGTGSARAQHTPQAA